MQATRDCGARAVLRGGQTAWLLPLVLIGVPPLPLGVAAGLSLGARALLAVRFVQPMAGVWLHPLAVAQLVAIQWWALTRRLRGRPVAWKRRTVSESMPARHVEPAAPSGGVSRSAAR